MANSGIVSFPRETQRHWDRVPVRGTESRARLAGLASHQSPRNALTVDVEDYFQVAAFARKVDRADWDRIPLRVERNAERLLDLSAERDVRVTFFVLGWIAEQGLLGGGPPVRPNREEEQAASGLPGPGRDEAVRSDLLQVARGASVQTGPGPTNGDLLDSARTSRGPLGEPSTESLLSRRARLGTHRVSVLGSGGGGSSGARAS